MSVLTMKVPAELAAKLQKVSDRRCLSKSTIAREALERHCRTRRLSLACLLTISWKMVLESFEAE